MEYPENKKTVVLKRSKIVRTKEQKAGFIFVALTSFLAIIFGVVFMTHNISSPFKIEYEGPRFLSKTEQQQLELEKQRQTDTDEDSLSDYDELYVYKTSPYLYDTDGDGLSDKIEIESGMDPNCATNDCSNTDQFETTPIGMDFEGIDKNIETSQQMLDPILQEPIETVDTESRVETADDLPTLSISEIRQLLLDAGADEAQVNALSDDELMQLYESALADIENEQAQAEESTTTDTNEIL